MSSAIAHRGPDGSGVWMNPQRHVGLAHRRLAIIDVSESGAQPIANESGDVWISFNGEIYNFIALRARLQSLGHRFRSQTDTEVIVHAFEEWGAACVEKLDGMFAFAVWDQRKQELLIARDRLGIKPLYYYWDGHTLAFASELKAILALPSLHREVDHSAIWDYLTYWYLPTPKTGFKFIKKLEPATTLTFKAGALQTRRYWDVDLQSGRDLSQQAAVTALRSQLESSVAAALVSDVPVGTFLSGGVDSGTVTMLMRRLQGKAAHIESFSVDCKDAAFSELEYARLLARAASTRHSETLLDVEAAGSIAARIVDLYDEPFADSSAIPTLAVSRLASARVKVVMSGDGGDELFGGYSWYRRFLSGRSANGRMRTSCLRALGGLSRVVPPSAIAMRLDRLARLHSSDEMAAYATARELFDPGEKRRILGDDIASQFRGYDNHWYFRQYWRSDVDLATRLQYLDLKTYLQDDILTKVDRASMAAGLEVRPPMLDHKLVELAFRIDPATRYDETSPKRVLRESVKDLLPAAILDRPKKGFSIPLSEWMKKTVWQAPGSAAAEGTGSYATRVVEGEYRWPDRRWALLILDQWRAQHDGAWSEPSVERDVA
jgi:asparagine synthase (glutamine-hydrolysing)